jgi:hypothetical protein
VVSFLLACIFLLLAAVWLYPSPVEGQAVMGEIARIFTVSRGPAMMGVFMLGAFAATFSTAFNYFDGCTASSARAAGTSSTEPRGWTVWTRTA